MLEFLRILTPIIPWKKTGRAMLIRDGMEFGVVEVINNGKNPIAVTADERFEGRHKISNGYYGVGHAGAVWAT